MAKKSRKGILLFSLIVYFITIIFSFFMLAYSNNGDNFITYRGSYEEDQYGSFYHTKGVHTIEYKFIDDNLILLTHDFKKIEGTTDDYKIIALYYAKIEDNKIYIKSVTDTSTSWGQGQEFSSLKISGSYVDLLNVSNSAGGISIEFIICMALNICSFITILFVFSKKNKDKENNTGN